MRACLRLLSLVALIGTIAAAPGPRPQIQPAAKERIYSKIHAGAVAHPESTTTPPTDSNGYPRIHISLKKHPGPHTLTRRVRLDLKQKQRECPLLPWRLKRWDGMMWMVWMVC